MPVPDEFLLAPDFGLCEMCNKTVPDTNFVHVIVNNDNPREENEKRWYEICKDCRERCRNEPAFEKYVTEKVFKLRLGRVVRVRRKDK